MTSAMRQKEHPAISIPRGTTQIQENTQFRVCFARVARDHLVPIDVQRRFAKNLDAKCVEFPEGGHFFTPTFEELMREI